MDIGSLVECIKDSGWKDAIAELARENYTIRLPKVKSIYTVREILEKDGLVMLLLEEICNKPLPGLFVEPSFEQEIFRELMPPISVEELLSGAQPITEKELILEEAV